MCHCANKFILYGQSNGVLRIYNNDNKEEKYFKLHEAGINEIKVFERVISQNIFLVFTCGEDCNLIISEFDINKNEINVINKIKNIHYSAIKSFDVILYNKDLIIITGGYDQIINVLLFNLEKYIIKLVKKFNVCTSEINSIKGAIVKDEKSEDILIYIFIGGLGMEFLKMKFQ
jgi:WD40 repeat protein